MEAIYLHKGIIILGHGSKREEANEEIRQVSEMLNKSDEKGRYETAFLSMASPKLEDIVKNLIQEDINEIIIMPLFLVQGNHLKKDIPNILAELKERYSNINFSLAKHIGPHPALVDIVKERIEKAEIV